MARSETTSPTPFHSPRRRIARTPANASQYPRQRPLTLPEGRRPLRSSSDEHCLAERDFDGNGRAAAFHSGDRDGTACFVVAKSQVAERKANLFEHFRAGRGAARLPRSG